MIIENLHEEYICRANIPSFKGSKKNPSRSRKKMVKISKKTNETRGLDQDIKNSIMVVVERIKIRGEEIIK